MQTQRPDMTGDQKAEAEAKLKVASGRGSRWALGWKARGVGGASGNRKNIGECRSQVGEGEETSEARSGAQGGSLGQGPKHAGQRAPREGEQSPTSPSFLEPPQGHRCPKRPPTGLMKSCVLEKRDCVQTQPLQPQSQQPLELSGWVCSEWTRLPTLLRGRGGLRVDLVGTEEAVGNSGSLAAQGGSARTLLGPATCPL